MRIVLAPNAYKGSLGAAKACLAMERGVHLAAPGARVDPVPLSDGGDGFLDVVMEALGGERRARDVRGPLGESVNAEFGYNHERRTAVIESASASGLRLIDPAGLDPMSASSFGTGELMRAALDLSPRRILIGLGGSATVDGGTGAAAALGVRFLDGEGGELAPSGRALGAIRTLDLARREPRLSGVDLIAFCDVHNPLLGPQGAARVYAPQKGAGPAETARLEDGLAGLAAVIERDLGIDIAGVEGAGAAGGLGAGLAALLGAKLVPGSAAILDLIGFAERVAGADLVLTGEGRLDGQSVFGKVPAAVARAARAAGVPCIAIAGSLGEGHEALFDLGLTGAHAIRAGSHRESMANAAALLAKTVERAVRGFLAR